MSNMNYYALDEALALIDGRELSLEFHVNSLIESGKLLTESIDITSLNEAEGAKSFKEKIVNALKKVIEKIKNFIKWIGTKVKALWMKIKAKVTGFNLKEKLKKAQEKAKAGKVNESVELVTEAKTLAELEEWLNENYSEPVLFNLYPATINIICGNEYDIYDIIYDPEESSFVSDDRYVAKGHAGEDRRYFIEHYEEYANELNKMIESVTRLKSGFERNLKEFEDNLRKVENPSVNSIEELQKALQSSKEKDNIGKDIKKVSTKITNTTAVINLLTTLASQITREAARINKYLGGNEE